MTEHTSPTPHHVYDEDRNLDTFSVSRTGGLLTAEITYVEDVTDIPSQGQIVEFRAIGGSVQGIVNHASLMGVGGEVYLHIQARRIQE
jgi:hypothetical protein